MSWNHTFQFWWLIPVFMILMCFFMCFVMRRRGMAGCCMSWRGSREASWNRRPDLKNENRRSTGPSGSSGDETLTESLKGIVEGLDQRLRALEDEAISKISNRSRTSGPGQD